MSKSVVILGVLISDRASPHHPGEEARSGPHDVSAVRGHAHGVEEGRILGLHTDPGERP